MKFIKTQYKDYIYSTKTQPIVYKNNVIWIALLLFCCKHEGSKNQTDKTASSNSSIVQLTDSSENTKLPLKLPPDHPDFVPTRKENDLENDIFYQARKERFKQGDSILVNETWVYFKENLQLGTLDHEKTKLKFRVGESAPGLLVFNKLYEMHQNRPDSSIYWPCKLVYLDSNYLVFNEFVINDNNPISLNGEEISCINCSDDEYHESVQELKIGIHIFKQADHYWTRMPELSATRTGWCVINYGISGRDNEDRSLIDINTILILDPMGNINRKIENLVGSLNLNLSSCGNFLWIKSGVIRNEYMYYMYPNGSSLYDLKTDKVVLHFNFDFHYPWYDFRTGLDIISPHYYCEGKGWQYSNTRYYFDYKNRNYRIIEFTNNQWAEITENWLKSYRNFNRLLELFPYETKNF